jgi:hypothetical protein
MPRDIARRQVEAAGDHPSNFFACRLDEPRERE